MRKRGGYSAGSPTKGPVIAAIEGSLIDVAVPGSPTDVISWEDQSSSVSLANEDPNPAYDESDRLWHLRFRAERRGTVELRLVRDRPGQRPVKTLVTLRIGA